MTFAPQAWQTERASWRAVIQLNLVRAVNTILDALATEMQAARPPSRAGSGVASSPLTSGMNFLGGVREDDIDVSSDDGRTTDSHAKAPSSESSHALYFTNQHSVWKMTMAPLRMVESDLKKYLGSGSEEINADSYEGSTWSMATPFDSEPPLAPTPKRSQEFTVRSMQTWKTALGNRSKPASPRMPTSDLDAVTEVIAGCRDDIQALWQDGSVRELIRRGKAQLQDSAT